MALIILSLLLGLLIGYFEILPNKLSSLTDELITIGLVLLLFSMGAEMGLNDKIISNLDKLGFQALALAVGSIAGSLSLIKLIEGMIIDFGKEDKN
ncbi:LysO family transporter [Acetohalobium arabaticum]|uniref:DUF340 domain-containing protein n=1 Tax=Acetohalobium arabaticum (strain ATCC 49924 / DSM 5501 / Z-7288) TaxID=574087 RepID=D9QVL5_ACEAZ|nr:LysO family transporter [Acetohalobium arabaticum]ADL12274.1 protein of unknown function DUF340 membrane [Acetohalobium arabaticum DSM 5501]